MFGSKTLKPGDTIKLKDGRQAEFQSIGPSPYYSEEKRGVKRVYVVALDGSWSDYVLPSEIRGVMRPWRYRGAAVAAETAATA